MDPYSISQCSACGKSYSNDANLRKHIRRQPLCAKWNAMKQSGSKSFVDDQMWGEVNKTQTEIDMEIVTEIVCPTCGEKYSNMGNLNRHLNASVVCRKWIVYNDVNGIEQYISKWANPSAMVDPSTSLVDLSTSLVDPSTSLVEEHDKPLSSSSPSPTIAPSPPLLQTVPYGVPFPPPAASEKGMLHIIWNLFLTDRESAGQNLVEMVDSNGVQLIIAMLPDLKHFVADTVDRDRATKAEAALACCNGVPICFMRYTDHTAFVDYAEFERLCTLIEECRRRPGKRANVLLFCNNGYQRSIPFLCYYLTKHHSDEVPDVECAVDLILPQVDRANFGAVRKDYIDQVSRILHQQTML
jgi:hypothetical protein